MAWLPTLPHGFDEALGRYALLAAFAGTAAGAVLWLAGSRFSRSLVTLLAVSVGAVVGRHLPAWFGWSIDGIGLAFVGAMVLGLSGYLLHTTWIGMALSVVLAAWVGVVAWLAVGGGGQIQWPVLDWSADAEVILSGVWRSLPGDLPRVMPVAIAFALVGGVLITVLSPKLGRVLTYTLTGLSVLVVMGLTALRMSRPDWLFLVPHTAAAQAMTLSGMVVLGVLVQWRFPACGRLKAAGDGGSRKE